MKCDVAKAEDWTALWNEAEKVLGGSIDLLLNNAGLNPSVILHMTTLTINFDCLPKK